MSIILIGGEKGGTGKTTLATNLATLQALKGRKVVLIDTDIQASASFWSGVRDEAGIQPKVACIQRLGKELQTAVEDLAQHYQDILIDAGGRNSIELRAGLVTAERVFIPIQPSQFDIWTLGHIDDLVHTAQRFNPKLKAWVVINRESTNPAVTEGVETQRLLADFPHLQLANTLLRERIAYRKAARDGRCVAELQPMDPKAVEEMQSLYSEVFGYE